MITMEARVPYDANNMGDAKANDRFTFQQTTPSHVVSWKNCLAHRDKDEFVFLLHTALDIVVEEKGAKP